MTRTNAGSLADLQRAFQDYVLESGDGFTGSVRDTSKADRTTLLDVYRDGYALRLIEVLTNDYPGVLAMAGPADFDHMARAYIAAHPSRHPNARWVGSTWPISWPRRRLMTSRRRLPRWRASNGRWARRSIGPMSSRSRPRP